MSEADSQFLQTIAGESAFFRALADARPVGIHREFHMIAVSNGIKHLTGRLVTIEALWAKFGECYDVELLESHEYSDASEDDGEDSAKLRGSASFTGNFQLPPKYGRVAKDEEAASPSTVADTAAPSQTARRSTRLQKTGLESAESDSSLSDEGEQQTAGTKTPELDDGPASSIGKRKRQAASASSSKTPAQTRPVRTSKRTRR